MKSLSSAHNEKLPTSTSTPFLLEIQYDPHVEYESTSIPAHLHPQTHSGPQTHFELKRPVDSLKTTLIIPAKVIFVYEGTLETFPKLHQTLVCERTQ